jgi:hypothetical protein
VRANIEAVQKHLEQKFQGNKTKFSDVLRINRAQLSKILTHNEGAGALFFGELIRYCDENSLNWREYIFLPDGVTMVTDEFHKNAV